MKILMVVNYGYVSNGAERCAETLKENLNKLGHDVQVISTNFDDGVKRSRRFSDKVIPAIDVDRSLLGKMLCHLWYPRAYVEMRKAIMQFQPDVIHLHTTWQFSPSILFATRKTKTPTILTVHGLEEFLSIDLKWFLPQYLFKDGDKNNGYTAQGTLYSIYYRYIQRPIYTFAFRHFLSVVVVPSKYMAITLKKEEFKVRVRQIYNGVDSPEATKIINKNKILFVGRLGYEKGIGVLIRAMKPILIDMPNAHLDIVGEGPLKEQLEKDVRENGLQNNVTFHGWLSGKALDDAYRNSTLLSVPSVWPEPLGLVCAESLAYGRPVVGSDIGGIPEIINNLEVGEVVPPNNPAALADAIVSVMNDKGLDKRMAACTSSAERFNLREFIIEYEKLYKELIGE